MAGAHHGDSTQCNNYGRDDMTVTANSSDKPLVPGANSEDGADMGEGDFNDQSWWMNNGNWNTSPGTARGLTLFGSGAQTTFPSWSGNTVL